MMFKLSQKKCSFVFKIRIIIISVHIPKTAGRSFRSLVQAKFKSAYIDDYADSPLNKGENERIYNCIQFQK